MLKHHYDWKSAYEIGIKDIDMQHHFFLDLINRLIDELGRSDNIEYQSDIISELNAYARFHFISEENMMQHSAYPGLDEHRKHHNELLEQLGNRELALELQNSENEVNDILEFLIDWFIKHTMVEDKRYADYLANK